MGHEVEDRDGHAADKEGGDFAGHEGDRESLENRVGQNHGAADHDGHRGEKHGTEADRSGIDHGFVDRHSFSEALLDEIQRLAPETCSSESLSLEEVFVATLT